MLLKLVLLVLMILVVLLILLVIMIPAGYPGAKNAGGADAKCSGRLMRHMWDAKEDAVQLLSEGLTDRLRSALLQRLQHSGGLQTLDDEPG